MSEFSIGFKAAAADRERYDQIIADIKRAEAHQEEMRQLAERTKLLAQQSDHRVRELKIKLDEAQKSLAELRQSIPIRPASRAGKSVTWSASTWSTASHIPLTAPIASKKALRPF